MSYPLKQCMVAWNAPTNPRACGARDQILVGPHPDTRGWSDRYSQTDGACWSYIARMNEAEATAYVYGLFQRLVIDWGMCPQAVHRELGVIDEYRRHPGDKAFVSLFNSPAR